MVSLGGIADSTVNAIKSAADTAVSGIENAGRSAITGVESAATTAFNAIMEIPLVKWLKIASDWWNAHVIPFLNKLGKWGKVLGMTLASIIALVAIYQISGPVIAAFNVISWFFKNVSKAWSRALSAASNTANTAVNTAANGTS